MDKQRFIKPPYCRQGNKLPILPTIIPLIPQHKTYVELFAGSAVLFFNIPKATKNVLNDLDDDVYNRLKLLQKAPLNPDLYEKDLNTLTKITQFYHHHTQKDPTMLYQPKEIADEILYEKIKACNGFSHKPVKNKKNIYQNHNPVNILNNIDYYKSMLKNVTITNKDYEIIVNKYDTPTTFFFLDPPYENTSKDLYKETDFNYERLLNVLQNIKGLFLLTINDSVYIRKLFKDFIIKPLNVKNVWVRNETMAKYRKELIIMNYN